MATYVTADPDTRIIQITKVPVGGVSSLNVQTDIYSDLKEDWLGDPTLQYLEFPFRSLGDPKTPTQQIGPYMFIRNDLGWRLRPYADNHELTLIGNLVAEDTSLPKYVYPSGYTISILEEQSAQAFTTFEGIEEVAASQFRMEEVMRGEAITSKATGEMLILDESGDPRFRGPIWEDEDMTIPYRGDGIERRGRLEEV